MCHRTFGTVRGTKVHQGRMCGRRATAQGRPSGRQTRDSTSQDYNHSGDAATPVSDPSNPAQESGDENVLEDEGRQGQKLKVLWPAAREIQFMDTFCFLTAIVGLKIS